MKNSFLDSKKLDYSTKACLNNRFFPQVVEKANRIWESSRTFDGFIKEFQKQTDLINTQGYFELIRRYGNCDMLRYDYIRFLESQGGKFFQVESECGSVKIGDDKLSMNIGNGYGDGLTSVVVLEKNLDLHGLKFVTDCEGKIGIFENDYTRFDKNKVVYELDGWYGIYNFNGLVVFIKWG